MEVTPLIFEQDRNPKERVLRKIRSLHLYHDITKQATIDKFWTSMFDDLQRYEDQLQNPQPFEASCYSCNESWIKKWDRAYWEYMTTGFRKRTFISEYVYPVKISSVILVFTAGVFRLVRANQDGKASFYANVINIVTNFLLVILFYKEGQGVLLVPKFGAILVSAFILLGICSNAEKGEIGI